MNIKQKLISLFALTACVPVILVAVLVIVKLRSQAVEDFRDSSTQEMHQISYGMETFFASIQQNVDYL
ncbi:hypothetical protein NS2R_23115, partial [Pseudomonas oryzihabitans]